MVGKTFSFIAVQVQVTWGTEDGGTVEPEILSEILPGTVPAEEEN